MEEKRTEVLHVLGDDASLGLRRTVEQRRVAGAPQFDVDDRRQDVVSRVT